MHVLIFGDARSFQKQVMYAYNVMFNFGTGMENVTPLKNKTLFQYGAFKCEPASEPSAHH